MELPLKYVYKVWEMRSFSKAAKTLFVSQPSLSATVAKHEKKLGFKIFDRTTYPISLTVKGKAYLSYLKQVSMAESLLDKQLKATDDMSVGSIVIGGRISSAYSIYPFVCGEFLKKHPNISITVDTEASLEKLKNKTVDVLLAFASQDSENTVYPLFEERLVIALSKAHPLSDSVCDKALSFEQVITENIPAEKEIEDGSFFSDIPFIKTGKNSDSDNRLSMLIKDHKVSPCIVSNAKNFDVRYGFMKEGLGAIFVSDLFLSNYPQDKEDILYFALKSSLSYRMLYLHCSKITDDNLVLKSFVDDLLEHCKNKETFLQRKLKY